MRRRDVIQLFGVAAAAWPLAADAAVQQPAAPTPVIGFLHFGTPGAAASSLASFRKGLSDAGYVEDGSVTIETRFAQHRSDRLPELAADLVRRNVAVIVATGSPNAVLAAKAATSTIPIVFATADDPVKYGLVLSLNRPGGNITGVNYLLSELGGKRLNLLLELVPQATTIAYLSGPSASPVFEYLTHDVLATARGLGREVVVLEAFRGSDLEAAFATMVQRHVDALIVGGYTVFLDPPNRAKILELAARHKIPTIYPSRPYVADGGLLSYSADVAGAFRQVGAFYVAQILKGAKPAELPVQQTNRFQLIINLKTAQLLGIKVPRILLTVADEVIE
jgi:putative tryptophan/tyrosine transport system substrate-binding protein